MTSEAPKLATILLTGASGFVGRRVVKALSAHHRIVALDWRRPDAECDCVRTEAQVQWVQADIVDREAMMRVMRGEDGFGTPDLIIHLAAHYEFEQVDEGPYWRTNVEGLRNVLDAAAAAGVPRFVFASSLAACMFPPAGRALHERSAPDGEHIYAKTKREGEEMLAEYEGRIKSVIIRFAAMYSDYCEYPPLFKFLETWLSNAWNRRMLGGRGRSAIPYLHVRDAARFVRAVVSRFDQLDDREVLIASPDEATSHRELFRVATDAYFEAPQKPIFIPRPMVRPGIHFMMLLGRLIGEMPFERPWMADFLDLEMRVDAAETRSRLGWAPRPRLAILVRLPLLVENYRAYPGEWHQRNHGAMHKSPHLSNLLLPALIAQHRDEIGQRTSEMLSEHAQDVASYQRMELEERAWNHRLALTQLMHSIRTKERKIFVDYCADLAARRHEQGFAFEEVRAALHTLQEATLDVIREDPSAAAVEPALDREVGMTMRFALDEVEEVFEELDALRSLPALSTGDLHPPAREGDPIVEPARERAR